MAVISVIVPVFNSDLYLHDCIDSILGQSFCDLELVLIDDGSTDNSYKICNNYANKDRRVIVIKKENGGAASARNAGLNYIFNHSDSKYIAFVDSDDYIKQDCYKSLIELMDTYNADIVFSGFDYVKNNNIVGSFNLHENGTFTGKETLKKMLYARDVSFGLCDKLFKKEMWYDVRIPEGRTCEDIGVLYKLFLSADNVYLIDKNYYCYRSNPSSVTQSKNNSERIFDYAYYSYLLLQDIRKSCPDLIDAAIYFRRCSIIYTIGFITTVKPYFYLKHKRLFNSYKCEAEGIENNIVVKKYLNGTLRLNYYKNIIKKVIKVFRNH